LFVYKQMRLGRGVTIPRFGVFSFSHDEQQARCPVFLVSKEFAGGLPLRQGIFANGNLRQFTDHGEQNISNALINYSDIAVMAEVPKEGARVCLDRILTTI